MGANEGIKMSVSVQHDGEYVLTSDGKRDFGEITCEIAEKIKRESGKIRLEIGFQKDGHGYGEVHIERSVRMKQLKKNGFDCARDFIEFVVNKYDAIYQGKENNIFIVRTTNTANIAFLSLKQNYNAAKGLFQQRHWKRVGKGAVQSSIRPLALITGNSSVFNIL